MDIVLTYFYDDGAKKNYGILEFKNGVFLKGDILCGDMDVITVVSTFVDTGKNQYSCGEWYEVSFKTLTHYHFSTENFNYEAILNYAKKCDLSLIKLLSNSVSWYIYNSAEDVVNYLCDNCLIDKFICEVWLNYGIEYLNAKKICEDYTVPKLSGEDCTEFMYIEEDNVWVSVIWE